MVATAIYSVTMALWKETAFPFCRATERRWKRIVVSRVFSSYYYYAAFNAPCVGHKDDESQGRERKIQGKEGNWKRRKEG